MAVKIHVGRNVVTKDNHGGANTADAFLGAAQTMLVSSGKLTDALSFMSRAMTEIC